MMKNSIEAIRSILLDVWDPLSVGGNKNLSNEYDGLIPEIYRALDSGEELEMSRLLMRLEEQLGVPPSPDVAAATAKALLAIRSS